MNNDNPQVKNPKKRKETDGVGEGVLGMLSAMHRGQTYSQQTEENFPNLSGQQRELPQWKKEKLNSKIKKKKKKRRRTAKKSRRKNR